MILFSENLEEKNCALFTNSISDLRENIWKPFVHENEIHSHTWSLPLSQVVRKLSLKLEKVVVLSQSLLKKKRNINKVWSIWKENPQK